MTELVDKDWGKILDYIESTIHVPRQIIELIAVKDILALCASGVSNIKISTFLETDEEYVSSVLSEFLGFNGWKEDLDFNPYSIYTNLVSNGYLGIDNFEREIKTISPFYSSDRSTNEVMYNVCKDLYEIEREVEDKWK